MTKSLNKKIIISLFFLLNFCFLFYFFYLNPLNMLKGKQKMGAVIRKDIIQRVTIAGTVTPFRKTIITAPYNGYLKKFFVKMGDKVMLGTPLVSVVQSLQSNDTSFPLRSPISGTVVQIEKTEGEYVKEGDSKEFILRIDDTSKIYILANVPEIDRMKIKSGQEAIIQASAILNRTYKGIIRQLSLAAIEKDQWSRSQIVEFSIRIEIINPDEIIQSGMSAIVDVITLKKENVLTLRHEFIRRENEKYFVIFPSGKRKNIEVGMQNEEDFEIISGLQEGQKIKQIDFSDVDFEEQV